MSIDMWRCAWLFQEQKRWFTYEHGTGAYYHFDTQQWEQQVVPDSEGLDTRSLHQVPPSLPAGQPVRRRPLHEVLRAHSVMRCPLYLPGPAHAHWYAERLDSHCAALPPRGGAG
jgi:hypothetical protein